MKTSTRRFLTSIIFAILTAITISAQTNSNDSQTPGAGENKVCLSQSAANECGICFKESEALRAAVVEALAGKKISEREAARLQKQIDDLEANHQLTVAEHKKETDALRKIIERLQKKQISFLWGLIKFRW